uniref:Uncharacterized protein n=1 Tax=Arundo donax TaxID=35708 RepID=A0A0A9ES70_ARUDO
MLNISQGYKILVVICLWMINILPAFIIHLFSYVTFLLALILCLSYNGELKRHLYGQR